MLAPTPERFTEEDERLCREWAALDSDISMHEYISKHASSGFKAYLDEMTKHVNDMREKGIMV